MGTEVMWSKWREAKTKVNEGGIGNRGEGWSRTGAGRTNDTETGTSESLLCAQMNSLCPKMQGFHPISALSLGFLCGVSVFQ